MHVSTVPALAERAAERFGGSLAVSDGSRGLSFAELYAAAAATAEVLAAQGIRRGDRVGVCMEKCTEQAVAVLAVLLADAVVVPILPSLKHDNIEHIVRDSGMRLAVTDEVRAIELQGAAPDLPLVPARELCRFPAGTDGGRPAAARSIGRDLAGIIYSSGSTGRPKGIMVSHGNLTDGARIVASYLGTGPDDRIGSVLSLNFDYGLNQLWQSLLTGAQLHLHQLVFPADCFSLLERERITVLPVMPVIVTRLFDPRLLRGGRRWDLSAVRLVSTSGGPVSARMLEQLAATFPAAGVVLMYGLTEAFRSTYLPADQLSARPASIGKAIPDVEILVLDDQGNDVGPGEPGELVHRGGCVAKGYWNAPEATAARFRELDRFPGEKVVFSGDLVSRDEDGYLYFLGRRDAMIKTSGFRVSPTEVEDVAVRFPGVDACIAVGMANVEIGEDIVLAYDATDEVDEAALRAFLVRELPPHMVPRRLVRLSSLPATGNEGKIDRQAVRERLRSGVQDG
jgi:amino acid adenylation domain-containing protein